MADLIITKENQGVFTIIINSIDKEYSQYAYVPKALPIFSLHVIKH